MALRAGQHELDFRGKLRVVLEAVAVKRVYRRLAVSVWSVAGVAAGCQPANVPSAAVKPAAEVPPRVMPVESAPAQPTIVSTVAPVEQAVIEPAPAIEPTFAAVSFTRETPAITKVVVPAEPQNLGPLVPLAPRPTVLAVQPTDSADIERLPPVDLVSEPRPLPMPPAPAAQVQTVAWPQTPIPLPQPWRVNGP